MCVSLIPYKLTVKTDDNEFQAWTINNDRTNPREFDPTRHLPGRYPPVGTPIGSDSSERPYTTFGAGRRMCPGIHVAERSLFMAIARLLWAFNMQRPVDDSGKFVAIDPDAMTPGFMVLPMRYEYVYALFHLDVIVAKAYIRS